jgi:peptide/nickel transport system substrate-binding protein
MRIVKLIFSAFNRIERRALILLFVVLLIAIVGRSAVAINENSDYVPVEGGYYREGIVGQPILINPIISDNPVDQDISSLVYADLSQLINNFDIESEGRVYIVKLKEGLKWDDGKNLTSDDVVFTIKTIQDPEVRSPFYKTWKGIVVERISELQVKFTLPGPYSFFENNLESLPVIPKHIFGGIPTSNIRLSSYNLEPVSSGPYSFKSFSKKRNGFITEYQFVANDSYNNKGPYIEKFYFKFYEDEIDLLNDFRMRKVDGFGTASLLNDHFYELNKVTVEEMFFPRYYAVFFNPKTTSILKEKDFRRVLSDSLNRKELIESVFQGKAQEFNTLSDFISKEKSQLLSKEEARSVISELKGEKELTLEIVIPEVSFLKETAEFVKEKWEELGIDNISIVSLKSDNFTNAVIRERSYEAVIFGNVLENDLDLFPFWHSSERFYPGLNLSFYSNEDLDTVLENIRTYEDPGKRLEEFSKAAELIKEDYPAAFLYTLPYFYTHHERLFGLDPSRRIINPNDRFDNVADWYVNRARVIKNTTSTSSS